MNDINYFIKPVVLNISRNQMFIGLSVLGICVFTYLSNKYLHNIAQTSNQYYIKTNTNSSNNLHNNTKIGISQINTNNIINNDTNYTDTNDTDIHDTDTYDTNIVKNNDVVNTFNTNITPNLTLTKLTTLQTIIYIYWNGDLNSTYLLIDLLLQDKIIQPLYIEKYTILKNLEYKKLEQMVKQYNDINSEPINIYQKKVMYKIKLYLEGISLIKHKQHKEMENIELLRKLILQKYPEFKGIYIVRDITHLFANLLKNKYKDIEIFKLFTKGIKITGSLLRQTKLSTLCPPKLRSIGRFQSIIRSVEWGLNAINFYKINKRDTTTKYQKLLSKSLSWLIEMHDFLTIFQQECTLLNSIQKLVKINGMNQNIYKKCMEEINNSKISQKFKDKIVVILKNYLRNASLMSQKINVSSDVIESLFGVYKLIFERSKSTDIASSSLYLPALSGQLTQELVTDATKNCSINAVKNWAKENLPETEHSKRNKLPKIFRCESKLKAA